jgi:Fe-S cluster biogenesis protein NfuA
MTAKRNGVGDMFIQTQATENPDCLKFLPGRDVTDGRAIEFQGADAARRSPLAERLFAVESVVRIALGADHIAVTKTPDVAWHIVKPVVLGAIMDHFVAGDPVLLDGERAAEAAESAEAGNADIDDDEISAQLRELIDTRIRPTAHESGGDVTFRGFENGVVLLELEGSAFSLLDGIANMLRHYVPEVTDVVDYRDALPKPGLETPEGEAILRVLEEQINPAVAGHGGHISLVDVQGDTAYIRLEGGCQGCGMADVTLKQGVETTIRREVPAITSVLDVTDHAGGGNPYFQPGKGGMSAM